MCLRMKYSWSLYFLILLSSVDISLCSKYVTVEISSGALKGKIEETWTKKEFFSFKGIPYAEPPVGKLRFKATVPIKPWKGVRNATEDGYACPQNYPPGRVGADGPIDENCLYLNVYTKKLVGKQPVIVWLHPGAFNSMTGASYWYGPDYLLHHNVVLVSINYRLGTLGFLSTGDESAVGNYGMKDQVEVLKWIQINIAKFGGDPQKVTLAGDSAGSSSALLHMLSPMSKGLFHNVIAMSGSIIGTINFVPSKEQIGSAEKLAKLMNCPSTPPAVMVDCLRNIPASVLCSKEEDPGVLSRINFWEFGPVIEPNLGNGEEIFLPENPVNLLKNKSIQSVPVVMGFTENEMVGLGIEITSNRSLVEELNAKFDKILPVMLHYDNKSPKDIKKITNSIRDLYFENGTINNSSSDSLGKIVSDFLINYPQYLTTRLLTQFGEKSVYFYKFSYIGQLQKYVGNSITMATFGQHYDPVSNKTLGPGHMCDVSYLLYPSKVFEKYRENDPDAFMVKNLTSLWYNFALTGNPKIENSTIEWKSVADEVYLNINASFSIEKGFPFPERMKLWETFFPL